MWLTILDDARLRVTMRAGLGVLACLPVIALGFLGDPFQAPRTVLAGLALIALAIAGRRATPVSTTNRTAGWLLGALMVLDIVAAVANHPASSVWGVHGRFQGLVTGAVLACAAIVGSRLPKREVPSLAVVTAGVLIAESCLMIAQALMGAVPDGTFGNRAIAAAWICVALAIVGAAALASQARTRWYLAAAGALGIIALGSTGTRGAWVGLALGAVAAIALTPRARGRLVVGAVGAALALGLAGIALGGSEPAAKLSPAELSRGSAASRLQIWRDTTAMIAARPLLGVGPGRYLYEFPQFESAAHAREEGADVRPDQAHNVFLQRAAESGAPAALTLVALAALALGAAVKGARRKDGASLVAAVGLSAYLGQSLFGVPAIETDVLGWLLAGVALAPVMGAPAADSHAPGARTSPSGRMLPAATVVVALVAVALSALHVAGDLRHAAGLAYFENGRFEEASRASASAVRTDPLTDTYRVALADSALYSGAAEASAALAVVEQGQALEPRSFDLALARARLFKHAGSPADTVADAYTQAVSLYPLGVDARGETIAALVTAGRSAQARAMARELLAIAPDNRVARELLR